MRVDRPRPVAVIALAAIFATSLAADQAATDPSVARQDFLKRLVAAAIERTHHAVRYMIVHNIGQGPRMEDVLFDWKLTGHYCYFGPKP